MHSFLRLVGVVQPLQKPVVASIVYSLISLLASLFCCMTLPSGWALGLWGFSGMHFLLLRTSS